MSLSKLRSMCAQSLHKTLFSHFYLYNSLCVFFASAQLSNSSQTFCFEANAKMEEMVELLVEGLLLLVLPFGHRLLFLFWLSLQYLRLIYTKRNVVILWSNIPYVWTGVAFKPMDLGIASTACIAHIHWLHVCLLGLNNPELIANIRPKSGTRD